MQVWGAAFTACIYGEAWGPIVPPSRATFSSVIKMGNESAANGQTRKLAGRISSLLCATYRSILSDIQKPYENATRFLQKMYKKILQAVGPQVGGKPSNHVVVWALFAFMFFLAFASLAVRFPAYKVKVAFITTTSVIICTLSLLLWKDFATASNGEFPPSSLRAQP